MTSDDSGAGDAGRFGLRYSPYAKLVRAIEQKAERDIDPAELAAEIREHGFSAMPDEVSEYLCRYLEGKIETRGRRGLTPMERRLIGHHNYLLYRHIHSAIKGDGDIAPEAAEIVDEHKDLIDDHYTPSENAWRLVSKMYFGHPDHYRKLQNEASAARSRSSEESHK